MIGKTLGHYQITSQIGKGGMGEVFQAKNKKLGRNVAIKVLPDEFARDSDRVARFQREAKVLASLNHPSIAAIYGLEVSDETDFLVLELVEGETLSERLSRGPIPVEESLKLAQQIAEALEAAHEKSIIHRDLKPSNIKVSAAGKVKVLDFGLAKAYAGDKEEVNLSNSPTLSDAATQQGVILGTAAYMSPEQARGKAVDKRADIWAFGCVLYEMLTGRVAFRGEDVSEILASVIKGDVKLDLLPAYLHPRVREVITRCLQKDLKRRYHDIADAQFEIEQALADPGGVLVQPVTAAESRTRLRTILPWAAATLVLGLIIAGLAVWNLRKPEPRQVMRFEYELPEGQQLTGLDVSPDGKQFVYGTAKGLYLRSSDGKTLVIVDSDTAFTKYGIGTLSMDGDHTRKPLLKELNETNPNTSRDGKYMAYLSNESGYTEIYVRPFPDVNKGKWQISSGGGESPLWSPDGRELFYLNGDTVMAISVETEPTFNCGKPRVLFKGSFISGYGTSPSWDISPDGKRFLMIKRPAPSGTTAAAAAPRPKINIVVNWFEELKQRVPVL
jgi:serine/threonine protein kinase